LESIEGGGELVQKDRICGEKFIVRGKKGTRTLWPFENNQEGSFDLARKKLMVEGEPRVKSTIGRKDKVGLGNANREDLGRRQFTGRGRKKKEKVTEAGDGR